MDKEQNLELRQCPDPWAPHAASSRPSDHHGSCGLPHTGRQNGVSLTWMMILLLKKKRSRTLAYTEDFNQHLSNTYSHSGREEDLAQYEGLITPPEPSILFNIEESTLADVDTVEQDWVEKPNKVCDIAQDSWRDYRDSSRLLWQRGEVAKQWRHAEGVWIRKEENASNFTQDITISLPSVGGKIFFSILAHHLTMYLLRNAYTDAAVQRQKFQACQAI